MYMTFLPLEQLKTPRILLQTVPLLQLNLFKRFMSICLGIIQIIVFINLVKLFNN